MSKIAGNEIRPGSMIEFEGQLWMAVKTQAVKPGKGGAYNQVELKNIVSGGKLNQRFRADEGVEEIELEKKDYQFLFANGDMLTFMDNETYDQITVNKEMIGEPADFLHEGMICTIQLYEGAPLAVELPQSVVMTVVEADPVVKGQTASSSYKSGKLENGRRVMIPPHIEAGTRIVVNTADGSYVERAKDKD